jgi:hypothetical protein
MSEKIKINLLDGKFAHATCSTWYKTAKYLDYIRDVNQFDVNNITIFTDGHFKQVDDVQSKIKIAWQVESPPLSDGPFYDMLEQGYGDKFDYIITYDEGLINKDPSKYLRGNSGGSWVEEPAMYPKKKNVCTAASSKNGLPGHQLRHRIISKYPQIDAYGFGYKPFKHHEDVFSDYRFVVVVENVSCDNYFSEKITNALTCGCIPVYWGCSNINDTFDSNGVIKFDTLEDLEEILPTLTESLYNEKIEAVRSNYNKAVEQFYTTDDWLYQTYYKEILANQANTNK